MMISIIFYLLMFLLMLFLEFCKFFSCQQTTIFTKQIQESIEHVLGWFINDNWYIKYYTAWFVIFICLILVDHYKKNHSPVPSKPVLVLLCTQVVSLLLFGLMTSFPHSFLVAVFYIPWYIFIPIAQFIMVVVFGVCIVRAVVNRN